MFNYLKWKLCFNGKLLAFTQPKWPNQLVVRIFGGQSTIRPLCYSLGQNLIRMAFTILTLKMVLATKFAFNETPLFIRFVWTILKTIANLVQIYTFTAIVTCYKMKLKLLIHKINALFGDGGNSFIFLLFYFDLKILLFY